MRYHNGSNTVPLEKGTETKTAAVGLQRCADAEATPSPSRRGLKLCGGECVANHPSSGSNTVPLEKGTETENNVAVGAEVKRGSNTVPLEKGTETAKAASQELCHGQEATPSPSRRGLKQHVYAGSFRGIGPREATPSPSRRGLKLRNGTTTIGTLTEATPSPSRRGLKRQFEPVLGEMSAPGSNTVPLEKGTETVEPGLNICFGYGWKQHRPPREGD